MAKLEIFYDQDEDKMSPHVKDAHRNFAEVGCDINSISRPLNGSSKVLLHSCCAPCSGAMIFEMVKLGLDVTIFFYNPNIHPRREYEIRKEENKKFASKLSVPFVDCDYDADAWYKRAAGMENDPERGARCTMCFDMRMERTAAYAIEHGFGVIATTNATSRWKDAAQVDGSGLRAAATYAGKLEYWQANWQTDLMTLRKYQVIHHMFFSIKLMIVALKCLSKK